MTIYYPDRNIGFYIIGNGPQLVPLVPGIMAALSADYGLSGLGFILEKQHIEGDTLNTEWRYNRADVDLGKFTLLSTYDRLVKVIYSMPGEKGEILTYISEYTDISGIEFPMRILTEHRKDGVIDYGDLRLSNFAIDVDIPDEVLHFKIPEDAEMEYVE